MDETFKLGEFNVTTTALTLDSSNIIVSPSLRILLFFGINAICESVSLSAQIPIVPLVCPVNLSPIIISLVFVDGPLIEDNIALGDDGFAVSKDS